MSNNYFDPNANPISANSLAKSDHINSLRDELGVSFDKLPNPDALTTGAITYCTDTGTADAYVIALPVTATSYLEGMIITFKPTHSNTGGSTVNVDNLGIKSLVNLDGSALVANDLLTTGVYTFIYNGTSFTMTTVAQSYFIDAKASAAATAADRIQTGLDVTSTTSTFSEFNKKYLGAKSTDPTLNNDGGALDTGALYFNTTADNMRVWNGVTWQVIDIIAIVDNLTSTDTASALSANQGKALNDVKLEADSYASDTTGGTLKFRLDGSTLYLRNDGTNA